MFNLEVTDKSHNRLSVSQNTLGIYQPSQGITVKIYPGTLCSDLIRDMMPRMSYDSAKYQLTEAGEEQAGRTFAGPPSFWQLCWSNVKGL